MKVRADHVAMRVRYRNPLNNFRNAFIHLYYGPAKFGRSIVTFGGPKLLDSTDQSQSSKTHDTTTNGNTTKSTQPARTRFAPSPTGFIHLGSLRTALYNYLLAKSTGGQFLLRLEDTDQKRLVPGAEENIYESLRWAGLEWDEGPIVGGPYGPYKQSLRSDIYRQYSDQLLDSGKAYRCFCSHERLESLSESAKKLYPPSLASYDRKCAHITREESNERASKNESYTIRLKAPLQYPQFTDLLHGKSNLQVQINHADVRYDDPVLVKSDGLPTYHLANVIDDHLMNITHVVRGEEWLPSTPKHLTLYQAFGWTPPQFVHIPLLTSATDKKLSKRTGDASILAMAAKDHLLPESLINFAALFGWSPPRNKTSIGKSVSEIFTLSDLVELFSLDGLTKGNAKVDFKKLHFFNQHFFRTKLQNDETFRRKILNDLTKKELLTYWSQDSDVPDVRRKSDAYTAELLRLYSTSISSTAEFVDKAQFFYVEPSLPESTSTNFDRSVIEKAVNDWTFHNQEIVTLDQATLFCNQLTEASTKKTVFTTLRFALTGNKPSLTIPQILAQLGPDVSFKRLQKALCKY